MTMRIAISARDGLLDVYGMMLEFTDIWSGVHNDKLFVKADKYYELPFGSEDCTLPEDMRDEDGDEVYLSPDLLEGVCDAISDLYSAGHDIFITFDDTYDLAGVALILNNECVPYDGLCYIPRGSDLPSKHYDVAIECCVDNIQMYKEAGVPVIVIPNQYNEGIEGVTYATSWAEILNILQNMNK